MLSYDNSFTWAISDGEEILPTCRAEERIKELLDGIVKDNIDGITNKVGYRFLLERFIYQKGEEIQRISYLVGSKVPDKVNVKINLMLLRKVVKQMKARYGKIEVTAFKKNQAIRLKYGDRLALIMPVWESTL
jgi:hypothetical protein